MFDSGRYRSFGAQLWLSLCTAGIACNEASAPVDGAMQTEDHSDAVTGAAQSGSASKLDAGQPSRPIGSTSSVNAPAAQPNTPKSAPAAQSVASQAGGPAQPAAGVAAGTGGQTTNAGSGGMGTAMSSPDTLTPAQLMQECGVAPAGLAPHIARIQSSKTPEVELSMAIQGDPSHAPVVLVHGFPDFWCGWAPVIAELAQRYYVVAPDMRGYNRSSKPGNPDDPQDLAAYMLPELSRDLADIVHYAAQQTHQKVNVVAHDWGAIVAWPYAHDYPEDLARLMAISVSHPSALSQFLASGDPALASAQAQQAQALTYITELVMNDSPAQFSANGYKKLFDSLDQKHLHKPNAFPEVEREAYKRMWDADNQASFKSQIKYYRANFGGGSQAPSSDLLTPVPTAFIAPVYDGAILYPHSMDYLREHVAHEQPLMLRPIDTGHFPQREEPKRLASMIHQFVSVDWQTP